MSLNFDQAIRVRTASNLVTSSTMKGFAGDKTVVRIPSSGKKRGLAIKSLQVTSAWDTLWKLIGKRHQIYFLTIAFDLSEEDFTILPPTEVPASAVYNVKAGEALSFTLGDGVPLFYPRIIEGGLIVYIIVVEADESTRHIGKVMKEVHEDLKKKDSLVDKVKQLITNPSATIVDEVLAVATGAMQPIATILESNNDDHLALFTGIYSATDSWAGKLSQTQNGTTIVLTEL
ncbi:MAG: hypothetical protein KC421_15500 [Anaerolineales bacterium]|nr:hypothetical protein [Anaerolineales bacterium]